MSRSAKSCIEAARARVEMLETALGSDAAAFAARRQLAARGITITPDAEGALRIAWGPKPLLPQHSATILPFPRKP
jgi:hypothetical protein